MNTGVIIQARMASSRLPGKVLMDLCGKSVLQRVIERAWAIRGVDEVVVVTHHDQKIFDHVLGLGYQVVVTNSGRYDESDVLSRYMDVMSFMGGSYFDFDTIVRITADCPLLDPEISSRVLENFHTGGYDYYSNCRPNPTYPNGMDTEVFSYQALAQACTNAKGTEREHVTPYIWKRPQEFRVGCLVSPENLSGYRMTLDTPEDLEYIRRVYTDLGNGLFGIDSILDLPYHSTELNTDYFDL